MEDPTTTVDAATKPPRRFRRTRIAVSVFFGMLTVALCVLWARSYWHADSMTLVDNNHVLTRLGTGVGVFFFGSFEHQAIASLSPPDATGEWKYQQYDSVPYSLNRTWILSRNPHWIVSVPAWFATLSSLAMAIAPWVSLQFSLRTLLLATTLVAVVLGIGVWAMR